MALIVIGDFGTHGDFGGLADLLRDVLGDNSLELILRQVLGVGTHTNELDGLSVHDVISDNLGQLGEMP